MEQAGEDRADDRRVPDQTLEHNRETARFPAQIPVSSGSEVSFLLPSLDKCGLRAQLWTGGVGRPSQQLCNVLKPATLVRRRSSHLPPRAPVFFHYESRRFHPRMKLAGAANKRLRPVMQLALRKPADAGLLSRVVVMETAEDDVQGHGDGVGRQQSGLKSSCGGQGSGEELGCRSRRNGPRFPPSSPTTTTELVRGKREVRGGVEVTAEECLLISLRHGFQRLSCEECSGRDNRTWNVSLCDKFSRRHLESPLLFWVPCSPPLPPRASDLGRSRNVKIPGLLKL